MEKILIVHHVPSQGGGTKSLIDMAIMLKEKYDVLICLPKGSKETIACAERYSIKCYETRTEIPSLNVYSGFPGYLNRYFISRLLRFRKNKEFVSELMELKPDAIFYNTIVTSLIAKDVPSGVKNVCIVRETFINSIFNKKFKRNFENKFSGVAYIAEHEKDFLQLQNPRQIVIPDCLEPKEVKRYGREEARNICNIPQEKFCVLFMGGLIQIKGLDVLLGAMERLNQDYVAIIAGNIDFGVLRTTYIVRHFYNFKYVRYLFRVKKKLKPLVDSGKIMLIGYIQDSAAHFESCDTVVFPSTSAHQPRPCIEAGEFHKSVILSDYEATKEYFQNGYNALTFMPGNAKQLAEKIQYLKNNPEENLKLGENNFLMSKQKHNYKVTQDRLNEFFDHIMNSV